MRATRKPFHNLFKLAIPLLAAMLVTGCSFNVGSKKISARPGTRMPGTAYTEPDGDLVYSETTSVRGNGFLFIVRVRDRDPDDEERSSIFPRPPWER